MIALIKALRANRYLGEALFHEKFGFLAKPEWDLALPWELCPNVLNLMDKVRTFLLYKIK